MQAMMSEPESRPSPEWVWADQAEHEARRILAETEPRAAHKAGMGREYRRLSQPWAWEISRAALADSLARFDSMTLEAQDVRPGREGVPVTPQSVTREGSR